jgi:hypothetical protein
MKRAYQLAIDVDEADLAAFRAGPRHVVVAKSLGIMRPNMAWLAWPPLARNVVSWDDSYGVYAAEIPAAHGAVARIVALVRSGHDRLLYSFGGDSFAAPAEAPGILAGHYDVRNDATFAASFGLVQRALVNGTPVLSPLHGVVLPPGFTADFTRSANVYVWAESGLASGAVITKIPPDAAVVTFGAQRSAARYLYDPVTKSFRAAPGTVDESR